MKIGEFKKLKEEYTKHQIIWKIVKGDIKIRSKTKNKDANTLTKKQYQDVLNMK